MNDDELSHREKMESERARHLAEAAAHSAKAAALERYLAEIDQIDAEFARSSKVSPKQETPAKAAPEALEGERNAAGRTLGAVAEAYVAHPASLYQKLRHLSRRHYDTYIRRFQAPDCADLKLSKLNAQAIQSLYDKWSEGGTRLATGHNTIAILRAVIHFGATVLEDDDCVRLSVILRVLKFKVPKRRRERLTIDQANGIIAAALQDGRRSIALAQELQRMGNFPLRDLIGEWVPVTERGCPPAEVHKNNLKWVRGLRWQEVDENRMLRHPPSWGGEVIVVDLKRSPLAIQEIERIERAGGKPSGAIIINEDTGKPYTPWTFDRYWRQYARAAGVPPHMHAQDGRARRIHKEKEKEELEKDRPAETQTAGQGSNGE